MGSIRNIVEAMEHCAKQGSDSCEGCPYYRNHRDGISCRQMLLIDAAEMLNTLSQKKQTSVCFEEIEKEKPAVQKAILEEMARRMAEAVKEAQYWRGYSAALQWAFSDRFEGMAEAEVPNNV